MSLCTMCMHGINIKKMWRCRKCNSLFCSHLCHHKMIEINKTYPEAGTAICHLCLKKEGGDKK